MKSGKVGRGGSGAATATTTTTTTTGPGTGSMKGTCSICGDRATKVFIIQWLVGIMPQTVAVSVQPLFDHLLFLLPSILQAFSGSWKAR